MLKILKTATLATLLASGTGFAVHAQNPMVGGSEMLESRNIVENAINSEDHETLVAAVTAADLVETLSGAGPFTVFAPTDEAFQNLPEGTVDNLMMEENKADLANILTYHVVPGTITGADLMEQIEANDGVYIFETVNGAKMSAQTRDGVLYVGDVNGNNAAVTIGDVMQSNGVIHVVDHVLLPM